MDENKVGAQDGAQNPVAVNSETAALFDELITRFNDLYTRMGTIGPYLSGFISTDAFNDRAQAEASSLAPLSSKMSFLGSAT